MPYSNDPSEWLENPIIAWRPYRVFEWLEDDIEQTIPDFNFDGSGIYSNREQDSEWILINEMQAYDNYGNLLRFSDANGNLKVYYFGDEEHPFSNDADGYRHAFLTGIQQVIGEPDDPSNPVDDLFTSYTWDKGFGVLLSKTDPNGNTIRWEYDGFGRLVRVYDAEDNMVSKYKYHYSRSNRRPF